MFEPQTIGLIAVLAGAWALQFWLTNRQTRSFHNRTMELKAKGSRMAVGIAGSNWKGKVYGVVVTDDDGRVTAAETLSGFTVFARSKPIPEIHGMSLDELGSGEPPEGISPKTWQAVDHAAGFLRKAAAKEVD